jgi:hypothetical protein
MVVKDKTYYKKRLYYGKVPYFPLYHLVKSRNNSFLLQNPKLEIDLVDLD